MARYSVNQIAAMLTEDPNIMNEMGPEGGRHPGSENDPGFSSQEDSGYTVVIMDRPTPSGKRTLQDWPSLSKGVHPNYFPLYIVSKDGQPFAASSEKLRGEWYSPDDRRVEITPELVSILTRLGVPESVCDECKRTPNEQDEWNQDDWDDYDARGGDPGEGGGYFFR